MKHLNLKQYLIIEPALILMYLPFYLTITLNKNFELVKICRLDLLLSPTLCEILPNIELECKDILKENENITMNGFTWEPYKNVSDASDDNFNFTFCKARSDSETIATTYTGIRTPIGSIFLLIIALFAGGWSDRFNLRKPLLYFPFVGCILSFAILLISSIYMDTIPSIYPVLLSDVVSSMFGGLGLFMFGAFTYMSVTTKEEDRTFRFGVFATLANILSFSSTLAGFFQTLGYRICHIISILIFSLGFLHVIFFVPEPKSIQKPSKMKFGSDNPVFENSELPSFTNKMRKPIDDAVSEEEEEASSKACDIKLVVDPFKVINRKRDLRYVHFLIILLIIVSWCVGAPANGEGEYDYWIVQNQLKWDEVTYSVYVGLFTTIFGIFGTFLASTVLSKMLKINDSLIGLTAAITTIISRLLFAFARNDTTYYIGGAFSLFESVRALVVKSISSSLVEPEEIARLFSLMTLLDCVGGFFIPPLYGYIYYSTKDTFPGAVYIMSQIFYVFVTVSFIVTYILLKKIKKSKNEIEIKNDLFEQTRF